MLYSNCNSIIINDILRGSRMNCKNFLLILLCGFMTIQAKDAAKKETKQYNCRCYCSFKCGPRYPDNPNDAPFIDPETGICFCQERDRATYFKHGCHKRHNAKIFNSCCAQQANEPTLPLVDSNKK